MTLENDEIIYQAMRRESDVQFKHMADRMAKLERIAECAADKFDQDRKESEVRYAELEKRIAHIGSPEHLEQIAAGWARDHAGGLMFKFLGQVMVLLGGAIVLYYVDTIKTWATAVLQWRPW